MITYIIFLVVLLAIPLPFIFYTLWKRKASFVKYVVIFNATFLLSYLLLGLLCYLIFEQKTLADSDLAIAVLAVSWSYMYFLVAVLYPSVVFLLIWLGIRLYKKRARVFRNSEQ